MFTNYNIRVVSDENIVRQIKTCCQNIYSSARNGKPFFKMELFEENGLVHLNLVNDDNNFDSFLINLEKGSVMKFFGWEDGYVGMYMPALEQNIKRIVALFDDLGVKVKGLTVEMDSLVKKGSKIFVVDSDREVGSVELIIRRV